MNSDEYHALPSLSHGKLEDLIRDPTLFHGRHIDRQTTLTRQELSKVLG